MKRPVEVEIMGQHLTVASDDGEAHVQQVAALVDQHMKQLANHQPPTSTLHLALLTALNIASEYWKLQQHHEQLNQTINRLSQRMLDRLGR